MTQVTIGRVHSSGAVRTKNIWPAFKNKEQASLIFVLMLLFLIVLFGFFPLYQQSERNAFLIAAVPSLSLSFFAVIKALLKSGEKFSAKYRVLVESSLAVFFATSVIFLVLNTLGVQIEIDMALLLATVSVFAIYLLKKRITTGGFTFLWRDGNKKL